MSGPYDPGTIVTIGTDPLVDPTNPLLSEFKVNGVPTDPTTVVFTWGWWVLQGSTWTQIGATFTDTYGNVGSQIVRNRAGAYVRNLDTTAHGGQCCMYRISGTGACQADKDSRFYVSTSPYA